MARGLHLRVGTILLGLAVAVTGLPAAPAPAEAAQPPRQQPASPSDGSADSGDDLHPARKGELPEQRTATSQTVRNDDGTYTTSVFSVPVHFQDRDGRWHPIDSRLIETSQGWRNAANRFSASFSPELDSEFLRFDAGGGALGLSLQGAGRGRVDVDAHRIRYERGMPDVDIEYEVIALGVKETIVLHSSRVPNRYRFRLSALDGQDVRAEPRGDGSWAFYMAPFEGPAFVLEAPYVQEAAPEGQVSEPQTEPVSLSVTMRQNPREGRYFLVDVDVDRSWLRDPARSFPLRIDPTITLQPPSEDAAFGVDCANCTPFVGDRLYMGGGRNIWESALQFDLAALPEGIDISDAQVGLYYDGYCLAVDGAHCGGTSHALDLHRISSPWTTSTQSKDLLLDAEPLDRYTLPANAPRDWARWTVTDMVRAWHRGEAANHGFAIRIDGASTGDSGPAMPSRRHPEEAIRPRLDITYAGDAVHLRQPETLRGNGATLRWSAFTGESGHQFEQYEVHRSSGAGDFTPSAQTRLVVIRDAAVTTFQDTTAAPERPFTYRIVTNGQASNARAVHLPAAGHAVKTIQPGAADGKDTFIAGFSSGTNCATYGAEPRLMVGTQSNATLRSLVGFDLRDVPADAEVQAATLSLWRRALVKEPVTVEVHRASSAWSEGSGQTACTGDGATWYDRDSGGMRWHTDGGDVAPGDPVATRDVPAGEEAGWHDFELAATVQEWVNGTAPNHGVLLRTATESWAEPRVVGYHSDDYAAEPALRPRLTVAYRDANRTQPPAASLISPGPGAVLRGEVTLRAGAGDDGGVRRVEFLVDGAIVGAATAEPFTRAWDSAAVGNGDREVAIRVTDTAGNVTTSAPVLVRVDNTPPPEVAVTAPTAAQTLAGVVELAADAAAPDGVEVVEFLVDDVVVARAVDAPYQAQWDTLDPVLGAYDGRRTITAVAHSTGGQTATSEPVDVTIANTDGSPNQASFETTPLPQAITFDPEAARQMTHPVHLIVTNTSAQDWTAGQFAAGYRWVDDMGAEHDEQAGALDVDLQPGESTTVRVDVAPPAVPEGTDRTQYRLQLDLRDADGVWLAQRGNAPSEHPVLVNRALRTQALGLERYYHYAGEDLGAGMSHLANVASGNSLWHWTPMYSPGRGLSTVLSLTYNSGESRSDSPAGNNVSLSISGLTRFGTPIDIHPNKADEIAGRANRWVELTDGTGTTHRFTGHQAADGTLYWESPAGVHLYLRSLGPDDPDRRWAFTRPDRVTFYFDADGYPTSVEDANGNRITYVLEDTPPGEDPGGPKRRVTKVLDPGGRAYDVSYYSKAEARKAQIRGNVKSVSNHSGETLRFEYYEDGNLLRLVQEGGQTATGAHLPDRSIVFTYMTANGSEPAIADPGGRADPEPRTSNQSTLLFSVRDPRGSETTFDYYGPGSSHDRGKLATRTDRVGAQTTFAYDIQQRRTTMAEPLGRTSTYDYDPDGKLELLTDPAGQTMQLEWDDAFKVTRMVEPGGADTAYAYDDNGTITQIRDQLGHITTFEYDHSAVDANDRAGLWAGGRTVPHISDLTAVVEPNGNDPDDGRPHRWTFAYDPRGNMVTSSDPEGHGTRYAHNADGTMSVVTDPRGNDLAFHDYDANGLPTRIVDAIGGTTRLQHDADGRLRWIQEPIHAELSGGDPRHYRTYFDYDSFGRLGRQSTPKSYRHEQGTLVWTAAEHDPNDNVVAEYQEAYGAEFTRGEATRSSYDAMDRETRRTGPDTEVDAEGQRTQFDYDAAGRLIALVLPKGVADPSVADRYTTEFRYDVLDRITRQTRRQQEGDATTPLHTHYCYSLPGDLVSVTRPGAGVDDIDCAAPPGHTTTYAYDEAHRLVERVDPNGFSRTFAHDANGNQTAVTNENGDTERRRYDQRGLLVRVDSPFEDGADVTTAFEYDPVGNIERLIPPRAWDAADGGPAEEFVTAYRYDSLNRLARVDLPTSAEHPEQNYVHRRYDANSNLTLLTLPVAERNAADVPADARQRLSYLDTALVRTFDDGVNPKTHFDWTAEGWQSSRTPEHRDGSGLNTDEQMLWRYFADGKLKERNARDGSTASYTYDLHDNLLTAHSAVGVSGDRETPMDIQASHDNLDRVTRVRRKAEDEQDWDVTTYGYDAHGNVIRRVDDRREDDSGTVVDAEDGREHTFVYDVGDRLVEQIVDGTEDDDRQRILNSYRPTGWEQRRVVQEPDGQGGWTDTQVTTWEHFANGKLAELVTVNGSGATVAQHVVGYRDDAGVYVNGHRTRDTFFRQRPDEASTCTPGSACTARYVYDARDRLVSHDDGKGTTTDYTLDPAGNILREADAQGVREFTYDGMQLTSLSAAGATQWYHYDERARLACVTLEVGGDPGSEQDCSPATGQTPSSNVLADYGYDPLDRLRTYRSFLVDPTGGSAARPDERAEYDYDALDRLTMQSETRGEDGDPTVKLYEHLGLSDLVTAEHREDDQERALGSKYFSYDAFGHRISMIDDPEAAFDPDPGASRERFTYVHDVHGSVAALLDSQGNTRATYGYTAYGAADEDLTAGDDDPEDVFNPFRYSGHRSDSVSGTLDMGARRFGPDTTRFLQPDALPHAVADVALSADLLTTNRYALAGGNPITFVEFDGHVVVRNGGGGGSTTPNPSGPGSADSWERRLSQEESGGTSDAWLRDGSSGLINFAGGYLKKRSEQVLEIGRQRSRQLMQRAQRQSRYMLLRLPILRSLRSAHFRGRADRVLQRATRTSLRMGAAARKLPVIGGALTAGFSGTERWQQDSEIEGITTESQVLRTAVDAGFTTGGAAVGAGVGGAVCSPASLTVIGAVVTAGCAAAGGWIGEKAGSLLGDAVADLIPTDLKLPWSD